MGDEQEKSLRAELTQYASSGVQALGIDTVEAVLTDVLGHTQAKHVLSVGSGLGVVEAALRLPSDVQIWGIDPDPSAFMLSKPPPQWVPILEPAYPTLDELIQDEATWAKIQAEGIILLLIWPPKGDDSGYDIDAVRRTRPRGVVTVVEPAGFSGSHILHRWLRSLRDTHGNRFPHASLIPAGLSAEGTEHIESGIADSYTLTHDYRRPGYLGLLPKGTIDAAKQNGDLRELRVHVECGGALGIGWDGNTKVLKHVSANSPLALAGGADLAGWRLTLVDGACPRFPHEIDDAARAGAILNMQFMRDPVLAMIFTCAAAVRVDPRLSLPPPQYDRKDGLLVRWPV